MMRPSPHRRGFTVVELLVVVVIIAALAGLAFPFVRSGMRKAQRASCLNNLRQIGMALESYSQDHNQMMPMIEAGRRSKLEEIPVLETVLLPYLDNEQVFHCPADKEHFEESGSSYLWNPTQSGVRKTRLEFFGTSDLRRIPLVFDKEGWHSDGEDGTNFLYADWTASDRIEFNISE